MSHNRFKIHMKITNKFKHQDDHSIGSPYPANDPKFEQKQSQIYDHLQNDQNQDAIEEESDSSEDYGGDSTNYNIDITSVPHDKTILSNMKSSQNPVQNKMSSKHDKSSN